MLCVKTQNKVASQANEPIIIKQATSSLACDRKRISEKFGGRAATTGNTSVVASYFIISFGTP